MDLALGVRDVLLAPRCAGCGEAGACSLTPSRLRPRCRCDNRCIAFAAAARRSSSIGPRVVRAYVVAVEE